MKKIILTLGLLFAAGAAYTQTADFAKVNEAYRDGKYDEAIAGYESILTNGSESGAIYYNLGNSYFKKQQLGKAVLNYERTKRLMPRDRDVAANAQFALSAVQGHVSRPLNVWDRLWEAHIQFYSANEVILILFALLILLGVAHLSILYLNWKPSQGRLAMGVFAALFLVFSYGLFAKAAYDRDAAVAIRSSVARFEPNEKATVYFEIPEGQRCQVLESEGLWLKVKRPDGKLGWVDGTTIEKI